jgi:hypothetical protein
MAQMFSPRAVLLQDEGRTFSFRALADFLLGWVKSLALYAILVSLGTILFIFTAAAAGYLSIGDRPGPGWYSGTIFTWNLFSTLGSWLPLLVSLCVYAGAPLFPFARLLAWLRSPRWLIGIFGALFAGVAALTAVVAAGSSLAMAPYPAYAGGIAGLLFGALRLPAFAGRIEAGGKTWEHWTGILAAIMACGLFIFAPLLPNRPQPSLEVLLVRVVPGPQPLSPASRDSALTGDELELLQSLGLRGRIHFGALGTNGPLPAQARALIVFTGPLRAGVELRQPDRVNVIYVQRGEEWRMYPPDAPTTRDRIKLLPSKAAPEKIEGVVEPARGKPAAFSWYPPVANH